MTVAQPTLGAMYHLEIIFVFLPPRQIQVMVTITLKKIVVVGDGAAPGGRGVGMYQGSSIELIMVLIMGGFGGGG